MGDEHLPDRRIDGTARQPRSPDRLAHRVEQQLADDDVLPRRLVEQRQLRVLAEVRAAQVERRHRALYVRERRRQAGALGDRYNCLAAPEWELGAAECLRCGGRRH